MKDKIVKVLRSWGFKNYNEFSEEEMVIDYDNCEEIAGEIVKLLNLPDVTNQRELLIDFANKINENCDDAHIDPNLIDWYIEFKDNS